MASAKSRKEEERKRKKGKLTSSPNLISDGASEEKKRKEEESPFFSQSAKGANDMERCKKSILTPSGGGPLTTEQKKVYMPKCSQCHEKNTAVTYLPYIFYRKISTKEHCLIFLQNLWKRNRDLNPGSQFSGRQRPIILCPFLHSLEANTAEKGLMMGLTVFSSCGRKPIKRISPSPSFAKQWKVFPLSLREGKKVIFRTSFYYLPSCMGKQ